MLFAALALSAVAARPSLRNRPSRAEIEKMDWVPAYKAQVSRLRSSVNLTDMAVPCAVCGIVVNEVEGFLLENRSDTEIMDIIDKNLCAVLPEPAATGCKTVVGDIPAAVKLIEGKYTVSAVCTELKYCDAPFPFVNDPMPIPTYTINLDLPAEQRFAQVCSIPLYKSVAQYLYTTLQALVGEAGVELEYFGRALNSFYFPPTYAAEIRGCADAFGVPMGWVSVIQLAYELSDACTSIVAKLPNGMIVHGRNLDFWAGMGFTDSLKNMSYIANFQRSGRTVYTTSQIAGYVGVLSGMVPGAFSVTVDTRFYPEGIWELFYEIVAAIEERDASLVTFLVRDSLEQASTYASAVSLLSNKELIADVYYTVAGVSGDQGAVIARNRTAARYTWPLDAASGKWFTGVSNYDVTSPQPWFDDRWDPAVEAMNAAGPAGFTVGTMYNVMSAKPVLNLQSTYTILAVPANSTWQSWTRWCPYPCVQ